MVTVLWTLRCDAFYVGRLTPATQRVFDWVDGCLVLYWCASGFTFTHPYHVCVSVCAMVHVHLPSTSCMRMRARRVCCACSAWLFTMPSVFGLTAIVTSFSLQHVQLIRSSRRTTLLYFAPPLALSATLSFRCQQQWHPNRHYSIR